MRYVYGEEVIIVNFIGNFILLLSVFKARRLKAAYLRICVSAAIGAAYAFGAIACEGLFVSWVGKLAALAAMGAAITKPLKLLDVMINCALVTVASFASGGCILFISYLFNPYLSAAVDRAISVTYPAAAFGMIIGAFATVKIYQKVFLKLEGVEYSKVTVTSEGVEMTLTLLEDSGNLLRTNTGAAVVLLENDKFVRLSGIDTYEFETYDAYSRYVDALERSKKTRVSPIALSTINKRGIQLIYKADKMLLDGNICVSPVYVSGASQMRRRSFDGIYSRKIINERCFYEY